VRSGRGVEAERVLLYACLGAFALYFAAPLFVMVSTSFKTDADVRLGTLLSLPRVWSGSAWTQAWSQACIGVACGGLEPYFWNSIRIVVPAVLLSTALGAANGYALSLWRFRGSDALFVLLTLGCFVPFQIVILPVARLLGRLGLAGTLGGIVLVHTVYGLAYTTLFFRNYYATVPRDLMRAAVMDGAGFFRIFWRIILPLSPPILVVTVIWQFTGVWNDFLVGAVFSTGATQPVTVALNNLVNTTTGARAYNVDMAATLIAGVPTLAVYALAGKYFVRGLTAGAVKG
jgi:glucose/mannose transport system permease protein